MIRTERPGWNDYFLDIAQAVAMRADCRRRRIGAVLVKGNRIRSTGYNGAPAGRPGCLDGNCPRGLLTYEQCRIESAYTNCIAVHAEANALLYASREDTEGGTLYLTAKPCHDCGKLIAGSGISRVVWSNGERIVSTDTRNLY